MVARGQTSGDRFSWPDLWWLAFLWIIFIPMVTMPLQVERLGSASGFASAKPYEQCQLVHHGPGTIISVFETQNSWQCQAEDVLPTLAPGLLNLVPFLWVWWPRRRARYAALVAGTLGAVRLVVPALIYLALGTVTFSTQYFPGPNASVIASLALWGFSVIALLTFPWVVRAERA